MQHAFDLNTGDGGALQRGQQDAAQGVAQRQTEAAFQRFSNDFACCLCIRAVIDVDLDLRLPCLRIGTASAGVALEIRS